MLVMILEKCPASLKGKLSRWLIEPKSGVFLGNPNPRIRDKLWEKAVQNCKDGGVIQIWSDQCPQGYKWRTWGKFSREFVNFEGLSLIRIPGKR